MLPQKIVKICPLNGAFGAVPEQNRGTLVTNGGHFAQIRGALWCKWGHFPDLESIWPKIWGILSQLDQPLGIYIRNGFGTYFKCLVLSVRTLKIEAHFLYFCIETVTLSQF